MKEEIVEWIYANKKTAGVIAVVAVLILLNTFVL